MSQQQRLVTLFFVQFISMGATQMEVTVPIKYDHSQSLASLYQANNFPQRPEPVGASPAQIQQYQQDLQQYQHQHRSIQSILQRYYQV